MRTAFYIYYRITPSREAAARTAVGEIMRTVEAKTGVSGRLSRRRDDPSTWMETYEGVDDSRVFESVLAEAVAAAAFAAVLAPGATRKTECFVADAVAH